jgi:cell division protein ZapB
MAKIEELADRVERLLLRFDELSRTQQLVEAQLDSVTQERDSLKSRLNAARSRVDALLDRLPTDAFAADASALDAEPMAVTPPGHAT